MELTPFTYGLAFLLLTISVIGLYLFSEFNAQNVQLKRRERISTRWWADSWERERYKIARELHDGLGQQLMLIKQQAESARRDVEDGQDALRYLDTVVELSARSLSDLRSISHGLRPVHLELSGLTRSIETMFFQLERAKTMEWSCRVDPLDGLLSRDNEIHLYRVLQEAVCNIQKHSGAQKAMITIRRTTASLRAIIWDDGRGFDIDGRATYSGLGIAGMRERMVLLGGNIHFDTSPGEGTLLTVEIPIQS